MGQPPNKIVQLNAFRHETTQEVIDDIGARAFLFLRDAAEEMGVPVRDVIVEHMLGLSLVMATVEGKKQTEKMLHSISQRLQLND